MCVYIYICIYIHIHIYIFVYIQNLAGFIANGAHLSTDVYSVVSSVLLRIATHHIMLRCVGSRRIVSCVVT